MTHYEVLGVSSDASTAEIRRAYLSLARLHHPDRVAGSAVPSSEDQMRLVNAAWTVLGDDERRRRYDSQLVVEQRASRPANAPSPGFVPIVDDDTDYAALLDDTPLNGVRVPRLLQLLPALLLSFAAFAITAGFVAQFSPLLALGLVTLILGVLSFGAAPAYVMFSSREDELA